MSRRLVVIPETRKPHIWRRCGFWCFAWAKHGPSHKIRALNRAAMEYINRMNDAEMTSLLKRR